MQLVAIRKVKLDGKLYAPGEVVPWFPTAGICVEQGLLRLEGAPLESPVAVRTLVERSAPSAFEEARVQAPEPPPVAPEPSAVSEAGARVVEAPAPRGRRSGRR